MTPTILARRDVVTVLICAPFDTWYDQWMLQADAAPDPAGVDYFDDAVRMFESAASGMAAAALRAHLDAHQTGYAAAGVTLFVEPLPGNCRALCTDRPGLSRRRGLFFRGCLRAGRSILLRRGSEPSDRRRDLGRRQGAPRSVRARGCAGGDVVCSSGATGAG